MSLFQHSFFSSQNLSFSIFVRKVIFWLWLSYHSLKSWFKSTIRLMKNKKNLTNRLTKIANRKDSDGGWVERVVQTQRRNILIGRAGDAARIEAWFATRWLQERPLLSVAGGPRFYQTRFCDQIKRSRIWSFVISVE